MKCIECGNELLTGDRYWQMGLCNECWSAYRFFNKPIPLNNPHDKIIEELQQQLAEKEKEIEILKDFHEFEKDLMCNGTSVLMKDKDKEIERLKKLVFDTRETIKHILIVFKRPVKGTTKEDCYDALEKLQKLYDTNGFITTEEFLDRIEKGE